MTWSVALRLGRVSNLPTVTSNVLAAVALSDARPGWTHIAVVCVAMSMLYVAGMYLNDAFDRDIDARDRPDRPIPSGQIDAITVFATGFALLASGVAVIAALCIATGAPWASTVSALALAGLIVLYDVHHKGNPLSPVVMGLCRAGVYTTAALAVSEDLDPAVLVGCACLISYLIGLTHIARFETSRRIDALWPLVLLAVPFVVAVPATLPAAVVYLGFLLWVVRALRLVTRGRVRDAVGSLIAGIALLDALFIARLDRPGLAAVAVAAFVVTRGLQRVVPGT